MSRLNGNGSVYHHSARATKTDHVFDNLYAECNTAQKLSKPMKDELLGLSPLERATVARKTKDGCTPLFIACKQGATEIVDFLLSQCGADIESRCLFDEPGCPAVLYVTPLWCASVCGHLQVVQLLIKNGAQVNAISNKGSTPVRSACYMNYLEIVKYLVDHGANLNMANYEGSTCLINSIKSVEMCKYLIGQGVDINARDIKEKSALHYAIKELCLDTVKLLLAHNANPFVKSIHGDDALQAACLRGDQSLFNYLISVIYYSPERLAEARELLGATIMYKFNNAELALYNWRLANCIRLHSPIRLEKRIGMQRSRVCGSESGEFTTAEELEAIAQDEEQMHVQSLLISERLLGIGHKETQCRLMFRGTWYAESLQCQKSVSLWRLCLEVRLEKLTLFNCKTCMTAEALMRLMLDLNTNEELINGHQEDLPRFEDVCEVFELLTRHLTESRYLVEVRPVFKKQKQNFDRIFKCVTHLIYLMLEKARSTEQQKTLRRLVDSLIVSNIRSAGTNDTLLHLSVSRLNFIKLDHVIFPNFKVAQLLLERGAMVNAQNESKSTPLHIATTPYNFNNDIIRLLLNHGAHIDLPNKLNDRPAQYIANNPSSDIPLFNYTSLKCFAASAVVRCRIPYKGHLPTTLERFVRTHEA